MNEDQSNLIIRLRGHFRALIDELDKVRLELSELKEEKKDLLKKVEKQRIDIELLEKKNDTLKMAGAFGNENGASEEAKEKVNKIVREIDQCIALLNQ